MAYFAVNNEMAFLLNYLHMLHMDRDNNGLKCRLSE